MWHGEGGHCCFFYLRSASQLLPPSPLTDRQFHHSHLQTLIHLQLKNSFSISISTFSPLRKMGLGLVMLGLFCGRVAVSSHWFNMSLHWFDMSSYLFSMSSYWLIISAFICVLNCAVSQNHSYASTVLARISPFCGRLYSAVGSPTGEPNNLFEPKT